MLNISKISTTLVTIYSESAQERLECLVIELIVRQAFPEEVLVLYNNQYYDCSIQYITAAVSAGTCTQEEGMLIFESKGNQKNALAIPEAVHSEANVTFQYAS